MRTGVTCVMPHIDVYRERLIGGSFVLNGAGEVAGLTQVAEWGLIETPILLTNTLRVGKVSDAAVKWMSKKHPGIGSDEDVIIPVVGECDDSFLNDAVGRHIRIGPRVRARSRRRRGGAGRRRLGRRRHRHDDVRLQGGHRHVVAARSPPTSACYTVGVLVLTNFGVMPNLRIDGVPVGAAAGAGVRGAAQARDQLRIDHRHHRHRRAAVVVAAGATVKRAALGIGRCGSYAAHGSGEIILAFSTANKVPRVSEGMTHKIEILLDRAIGPLYEAVIEATEEAIVNALCMADDMTGQGGNFAPALPLDRVAEIMAKYRPIVP